MEFSILQILPRAAKIKIDKKIRNAIFKEKTVTEWSKLLGVSLKNTSRYINGSRSLPIYLLNNLISVIKVDTRKLQNKIEIKIDKSGKYLKIGPFIEVNEEWVYVGELIKGDGHILKNFWNITFVNNNKILINHVKKFFLSLGLKSQQISLI